MPRRVIKTPKISDDELVQVLDVGREHDSTQWLDEMFMELCIEKEWLILHQTLPFIPILDLYLSEFEISFTA